MMDEKAQIETHLQDKQKALNKISNISTGIMYLSEDGVELDGEFTLDDLKKIIEVLETPIVIK